MKALTVSPCYVRHNEHCQAPTVPAKDEHKPAVTLVLPMNEDCKATGRKTARAAMGATTLVGANATTLIVCIVRTHSIQLWNMSMTKNHGEFCFGETSQTHLESNILVCLQSYVAIVAH